MRTFPKFWSTHREEVPLDDGQVTFDVIFRGWSDVSPADAARVAWERVQRFKLSNGAFPRNEYYPGLPVREETLHELRDGEDLIAIVSRNRYGAEILNTDAFLIADVDVDEFPKLAPAPHKISRWSLFSRRESPTVSSIPELPKPSVQKSFSTFAARHPEWGVRIYRTFGGYRVFVLGTDTSPSSEAAQTIMQELNTDPLYMKLCDRHDTYRARLTPKPWRVELRALGDDWPRTPARQQFTDHWLEQYAACSAQHATCHLEVSYGAEPTNRELRVIALHDQVTRAQSGLPLA